MSVIDDDGVIEKIAAIQQSASNNNLLINVFNSYKNNIDVLSLDCFDTILFRNAHEPNDVFYDLAQYDLHRQYDCNHFVRCKIERDAYKKNLLSEGTEQVTLYEIYKYAYPHLDNDTLMKFVSEEIDAELKTLYPSSTAIDLIKHAKQANKKIVIASDTYFSLDQLTNLLNTLLPQDVFNAIDRIYTSSDKKVGKSKGLFNIISREMGVKSKKILHMGDNLKSDYDKPKEFGANAYRVLSYESNMSECMRTYPLVAKMLDPSVRSIRSLNFFCKDSISSFSGANPDKSLASCIGMILYAFSIYLKGEIQSLRKNHKKLKIAFLLRDAHLPYHVFQQICPEDAKLVRISRFTSFASSFRSKQDVINYIAPRIDSGKYSDMLKQLLLPPDIQKNILRKTLESNNKQNMFMKLIMKDHVINKVVEESIKFSTRLNKYLKSELNLASGDTLLFVDLGYTGTSQILLEPIYKKEHEIDIIGRYLISLSSAGSQATHDGLISNKHFDDKALVAVVTYIALFEQICTAVDRSVTDFDENGQPIYSTQSTDNEQKQHVRHLQNLVAEFIDHLLVSNDKQLPANSQDLRDAAFFNLGRLIYSPTAHEIAYFYHFSHDVNLGTDDTHKLFDVVTGWDDLIRSGWLTSINAASSSERMNYPTEWRAFDLSLTTTLLAQHTADFALTGDDVTKRKINIDVLIKSNQAADIIPIQARHTYDGVYRLTIPVVPGVHIGVCMGKRIKQFELLSVALEETKDANVNDRSHIRQIESDILYDMINQLSGALFECQSEDAMLIYAPPEAHAATKLMHVNFRPLGGLLFDLE